MDDRIKNMSFEQYLAVDACQQSVLKHFWRSAKLGAHLMSSRKFEYTAQMRLGTLVHMRLLEPDRVDDEVVWIDKMAMMPQPKTFQKQESLHPGRFVAPLVWRDHSIAIAQAVRDDSVARSLIDGPGAHNELSLFWTDMGVKCKARIDRLIPRFGIADLKVTSCTHQDEFARQAGNLGWDFQNAWYQRGCIRTGLSSNVPGFAHICVDPETMLVRVYELDQESVESGWKKCCVALQRYAAWKKDGTLLGEPSGVLMTRMRPWDLVPDSMQAPIELRDNMEA